MLLAAPAIQGKRIPECTAPHSPSSPCPSLGQAAPSIIQWPPKHPVAEARGQRWASGTAGSCPSSCCYTLGLGFSPSCFLHGVETLCRRGRCSGEFAMADGGEKRKGQSTVPVGMGTQHPRRECGVNSPRWPACNESF